MAQEVPGLVQLHLKVGQPGAVVVAEALPGVLCTEGLLLGDQLGDVLEDGAVAGRCACRLISHAHILPPAGSGDGIAGPGTAQ